MMKVFLLLCCLPLMAQQYIPHIANPAGSFSATVTVTNASNASDSATLTGYSSSGTSLGSMNVQLNGHGHQSIDPAAEWGNSISYVRISNGSSLQGFVTYQAEVAGAMPATASQKVASATWRFSAGDWSLAWDGIAVVNTSSSATSVSIRQLNRFGGTVASHSLGNLNAGEKVLVVLSDYFQTVANTEFEIRSNEGRELVMTALRGNSNSTALWENAALGQVSSQNSGSHSLEILQGLWVFSTRLGSSVYEDSYALAELGSVDGIPVAYGYDDSGNLVIGTQEDGVFVIYDQGSFLDQWFIFEIDQSGVFAEGCYYQGSNGTITSACYATAGARAVVNTKHADSVIDVPELPLGSPDPAVVALGQRLSKVYKSLQR